jgi:hypothetical protein
MESVDSGVEMPKAKFGIAQKPRPGPAARIARTHSQRLQNIGLGLFETAEKNVGVAPHAPEMGEIRIDREPGVGGVDRLVGAA